jgi:hypothetical protein
LRTPAIGELLARVDEVQGRPVRNGLGCVVEQRTDIAGQRFRLEPPPDLGERQGSLREDLFPAAHP